MPSECTPRFLASDNTSGICPEAMQYLLEANQADDLAYGNDRWTARAADRFREMFDYDCDVFSCSTALQPTHWRSPRWGAATTA